MKKANIKVDKDRRWFKVVYDNKILIDNLGKMYAKCYCAGFNRAIKELIKSSKPSLNSRTIQSAIPICPKCKQPTKTLVDCCCNCNYPSRLNWFGKHYTK